MEQRVREKILKIADNYHPALQYLFEIYRVDFHEAIFDYLLANNLTGNTLVDLILHKHRNSTLSLIATVSKTLEKRNTARRLIVGENFN